MCHVAGKVLPQLRFIAVVIQHGVRKILIMGIGECVRQIVGQLTQRIVLPHGPGLVPALQTLNMAIDVIAGIAVIVSAELPGPEGALQIAQRIAVRLKGAEEKGQLEPSGLKALMAPQQSGGQQSVAAFLQGRHLQSKVLERLQYTMQFRVVQVGICAI